MRRLKGRMPSPAMTVAGAALVIALAGTAMAAPTAIKSILNKQEKKQVKAIAKNQVNKLAPGLSVANAATATRATNATNATNAANASDADALGGVPPSGYLTVKDRSREEANRGEVADYAANSALLTLSNLEGGDWVITAAVQLDNDEATVQTPQCRLDVNGAVDLDFRSQTHGPVNTGGEILSYTLIGEFTSAAGGVDDVIIRCTNPPGTFDASERRIVATLVS